MSDPSERPLRGAVIGYGFIGSLGHVPAVLSRAKEVGDVRIVAVADTCRARREEAARKLPRARIYADAEALLSAERGHLDYVDICTPPAFHAEIAHRAFDAGLHVMCEKPLAPTQRDAEALLHHAERARRVLYPCHNYKHAPVVKAIRGILDEGVIGPVHALTLSTFRNTHAKGVADFYPDWRRVRRFSGGGIAMDHGSHTFYLTFDWMGSYPISVSAKAMTLGDDRWDTEDTVSLALTFPNGLVHAHLTWTAGVRKVMYTLQGERGALTVDDDDLELALMEEGPSEASPGRWKKEKRQIASHWMDASHTSWFGSLFDGFREAIRADDFVGRDAREAYLCAQVITAAYRSAREGSREVRLEGLGALAQRGR